MRYLLILPFIALAACSPGFNDALAYNDVPLVKYSHGGRDWRVFDKANEGMILVTATGKESFVQGASLGATSGPGGLDGETAPYQAAANAFIASRGCQVVTGRKLIEWTYEFLYDC